MKELEKKGQQEAAATLKIARKRKDKLARLIAKCDNEINKMELELRLKESPPDLEEVIATIKDPESVVEIVPMPSTQGGEVQGGVDVELNSKNTNPTDSDD